MSVKKEIRRHVRRSARLVIEKYYAEEKINRPKPIINKMVKAIEKQAVPALLQELTGNRNR